MKPNSYLNATVMEIVENQLRDGDPPETKVTFDRLLTEGHDEDEARRLIGCVVVSEIFDIMKNNEPFNAKGPRRNNSYKSTGLDRVVPVAVKVGSCQFDACELGAGDLFARRIAATIQRCANLQAGGRRGMRDQLDDHLVTDQRLAAPVLRDV